MGEKEGNGRRFNDEWRRFRAGFNMKFLNNFKLNNVWNIGGMDGLESYNAENQHMGHLRPDLLPFTN